MTIVLIILIGLAVTLLIALARGPLVTAGRSGKIFAFVCLFMLPLLTFSLGFEQHMDRAKQTSFCLSCHVMQPYGRSLHVDNAAYIPAAHFQNNRIPRDYACYTCHTDYTLFGGAKSKLRGLRHVYKQYISHPANPIKLYTPFNNRECLHCHLGARTFKEGVMHNADPQTMIDIKSNKLSCVSSGCHDTVHNAHHFDEVKFWKEQP
jgi:cytochrome c-type protein NapC